jgi:hypothetical protein
VSAGRQWVKLHTRLLHDDAFLDLSAVAKAAFMFGLLKAGADLTDGILPSKVSSVARFAGLSEAEAQTAISELVKSGFWTANGDTLVIRTWAKYQTPSESFIRTRDGARQRKAKERGGAVAESPTDFNTVRSQLWSVLDQSVLDGVAPEQAVAMYQRLHESAIEKGSPGGKYADVKGVGPVSLANVVVCHAATRWFGMEQDDPQMRRLWALRRDYGTRVFEHMPRAAAAAKGDPVSYLTTLLKKETSR